MSLLLDALKRAEQEKLARQPAGAVPVRAVPAPSASGFELQPISSAPAGAPGPAPAAAPARGEAANAAQNAFQAKNAPDPEASRSRALLWTMVGAVAFVAIGAAAYVWYSVKALTPQQASAPRPRAAPTPPPASGVAPPPASGVALPPNAASASLPPTTAMGSIVPAPGSAPAAAAPTDPVPGSASVTASSAPAASAAAAAPSPVPAESTADRLARAAALPRPPMQLERSAPEGRRVPAEISAGYDALRKGDWASARRAYEAAIASNPASVDAHLGLATLAARSANRSMAADYYRRTLDLDPRNATALAGLAALADYSRPEALEAQLRADLDRAPESAALHFTLGNLHSAQGRWSEAQSAYYEAHRLDPGSPEIAHNLAVSLDHLGQQRLAAAFYQRALESANGRATAFDPAAVARRLAEIR